MKELDLSKLSAAKLQEVIDSQSASGLSQKEYCKKNNISPIKFTYWRNKHLHNNYTPSFQEIIIDNGIKIDLFLSQIKLTIKLSNLNKLKDILLLLKDLDVKNTK